MKVLLWIKYLRIYHKAWFFSQNKITFDMVSLWKIISENLTGSHCARLYLKYCTGSAGHLLWSLVCHSHLIGGAFCTTSYFKTNHSLCFYLISRLARKLARRRRTNLLLIAVSVIFFTSWFPLNTLNMVMDIFGHHLEAVTQEVVMEIIKPWFKLRKMVFDWNRLVLSTTLWPTTGVGRNFKEFIHFRPKYRCTLAFRALSSNFIFRCFGANLLKKTISGPDASHFRWLPPLCHQLSLHKPNLVRFFFFHIHLVLDLLSNIETWLWQQKNQI